MTDRGYHLIGGQPVEPAEPSFRAVDPRTGADCGPRYGEATAEQVDEAVGLAADAFGSYRGLSPTDRADFLELIADEIAARTDAIAELVQCETGLPAARVAGETGRTLGQLRMFAEIVREGAWQPTVIEPALPERSPLPRPDLRQRSIPVGPVAVFGASNFPLAFSVAGGDTASALAAGAPVVVKAHPAHPGTSELVGRAIAAAVARCGLHPGVFSLLHGAGHEVGTALVTHRQIRAVGFTGSRRGGLALAQAAANREVPIPVFAEMSAVNPVFVLPQALADDPAALARGLATSVTGSAGQLCTKPGLVFLARGEGTEAFLDTLTESIAAVKATPMLTPGIHDAYASALASALKADGVRLLGRGSDGDGRTDGIATVAVTDLDTFVADPALQEEIFGPAALVVVADDPDRLLEIPALLEGQLTATTHLAAGDHAVAAELLPELELLAGRVIVNGWPTGVDVGQAMVHGGPFPATTAPATTSVGGRAVERWLRPVVYQNVPTTLLPSELRDED